MEDILTSIRRIIDDSSTKAPNTSVPGSEEIANDDSANAASAPQGQTSKSKDSDSTSSQIGEIPELDSFLEALDAKYSALQSDDATGKLPENVTLAPDVEASVQANESNSEAANSSIALIDEAMGVNNLPGRESSKYEARFSEDDRTAFAAVGDVLTANTSNQEKINDVLDAVPLNTNSHPKALVSEPARARVGGSLNNLSEVLAQEAQRQLPAMTESILKPMLADWLDNNLPSMVERLVREEIERIARGD